MSKSLKNFITIEVSYQTCIFKAELTGQEALEDYTARQLRLAFMLQSWNAKMDFKKDLISDVRTKEETFDVSCIPLQSGLPRCSYRPELLFKRQCPSASIIPDT